jgi:hypothetical protein
MERPTRDDLSPAAAALLVSAAMPAGVELRRTPDRESHRARYMAAGLMCYQPPLVRIAADAATGIERVHATAEGLALLARPTHTELAARKRRILATIGGVVCVVLALVVALALRFA